MIRLKAKNALANNSSTVKHFTPLTGLAQTSQAKSEQLGALAASADAAWCGS